jgi:tetratricopeptide (TPR) repeat protein/DNA-binding CsgD family transcriptional regulator
MAQASSRIGVSYYKQKNYPKALEYLFISLDLSRKTNSTDGVASNLNSIGNVYSDQNDFQKSLKNYMEALAIAVKNGDLRMEGSISLNIGTTYLKMKNYQLSIEYFLRALTIFKNLNNELRITRCQVQLGEYYLATKDYRKGFEFAGEAMEHSTKQGFKEVELSAAQLLHRLSLAVKDTLKAYHFAILESQLKDSLINGEKKKMLTKLEAQYQFDKEQTRKAIAQQKKDFILIILIISLLSGVIILILIWGRQKIKSKNAILEKENLEKELDFKNKEMVLNVMSLMKKNEMLADLSEKLIRIEGEATSPEGKETIKKVAKELQKSQEDEIWKEFSLRFKEVHGEFYDKLLAKCPTLSPNELKLCAFLRLNMSSKDIAALTGQKVSSLETARYRLRQKLGISNADVNLITFLSQL